jgi:hypothetical protein
MQYGATIQPKSSGILKVSGGILQNWSFTGGEF